MTFFDQKPPRPPKPEDLTESSFDECRLLKSVLAVSEDVTKWGDAYRLEMSPEECLRQDLGSRDTEPPLECEHCGEDLTPETAWVCKDTDFGSVVFLCGECHVANHLDLGGWFEPNITEVMDDRMSWNNANEKD